MAYAVRQRDANEQYDKSTGMQSKRTVSLSIGVDAIKTQEHTTRYPDREALSVGFSTYRKEFGQLAFTSDKFAEFQRTHTSEDFFDLVKKQPIADPNAQANAPPRSAVRAEDQVLVGESIRDADGKKKRPFLANCQFDRPFLYRTDSTGYHQFYPGLGVHEKQFAPDAEKEARQAAAEEEAAIKAATPAGSAYASVSVMPATDSFGKESLSERTPGIRTHLPRYRGYVPGEEFVYGTSNRVVRRVRPK